MLPRNSIVYGAVLFKKTFQAAPLMTGRRCGAERNSAANIWPLQGQHDRLPVVLFYDCLSLYGGTGGFLDGCRLNLSGERGRTLAQQAGRCS
jgi:hypothetical protein